jgi:hypothetical protein
MKRIKVVVEKTNTGFSAYANNLPVFTTGASIAELKKNIVRALNFYGKEAGDKKTVTLSSIELNFSIPSFFELYPINVKSFSKRIGINYTLLSQYVQGRRKPSPRQTERIVVGLQEVGKELSEVSLV